jgi:ParB-like chromosome segregation protein Spo0J
MAKTKPAAGSLHIQRVHVRKINPAPYNPRVALSPGDPDFERLARSIDTFGYVDPLIWNRRTGNLVGGHQRFTVLRGRGVKAVDVSVVDLDEDKEKLLNLALNKVKGRWDQEGLSALLGELAGDESIDVALSGFSDEEIGRIVKEGDQLVEKLVAADEPEDEEEEGGGGGGRPPVLLIIECSSKGQRKNLMKRLAGEGLACRVR